MKFALIALLTLFSCLPAASATESGPENKFAVFARWRVIHDNRCTQREVNRGCRSDWECKPDGERCQRMPDGDEICVPNPGICWTACYCR